MFLALPAFLDPVDDLTDGVSGSYWDGKAYLITVGFFEWFVMLLTFFFSTVDLSPFWLSCLIDTCMSTSSKSTAGPKSEVFVSSCLMTLPEHYFYPEVFFFGDLGLASLFLLSLFEAFDFYFEGDPNIFIFISFDIAINVKFIFNVYRLNVQAIVIIYIRNFR